MASWFGMGKKDKSKSSRLKPKKPKKGLFENLMRHGKISNAKETPDVAFQTASARFLATEHALEDLVAKSQEYVEVLQAFTEASTGVSTVFMHTNLSDSTVRGERSAMVKALMNVDRSLRETVRKPLMEVVIKSVQEKVNEMQKLHPSIEDRNFYKQEYDHYLSKVGDIKAKIQATEKEETLEKLKDQLARNETKLTDWKRKLDNSSQLLLVAFKQYQDSEGALVQGEFDRIRFAHAKFFGESLRHLKDIGADGSGAPPSTPHMLSDILAKPTTIPKPASTRVRKDSDDDPSSARSSLRSLNTDEGVVAQGSSGSLETPSSRPLPTPPHRRPLPNTPMSSAETTVKSDPDEEAPPARPKRRSVGRRGNSVSKEPARPSRVVPPPPGSGGTSRRPLPDTPMSVASVDESGTTRGDDWTDDDTPRKEPEKESSPETPGVISYASEDAGLPKAIAMYDYEPEEGDDDEVALAAGEVVDVVNSDNSDWWLVRTKTGDTGLVPANYLDPNPDEA